MNKFSFNLFRWIAILPGSIAAAFLVTFPLHWVLYFSFVNGSIFSGFNIEQIEYILSPLATSLFFVLAGYKIAPKYKMKTAIILSSFLIVSTFAGLVIFSELIKPHFRMISGLVGVSLALYIVWKKTKNEAKKA